MQVRHIIRTYRRKVCPVMSNEDMTIELETAKVRRKLPWRTTLQRKTGVVQGGRNGDRIV